MTATPTRRQPGKRLFDVIVTLVLLPLVIVIVAVTAAIVWIALGSPVLFRQMRAGRGGRGFVLCKFRTMTTATDAQGHLLPDDARLAVVGRALRRTSLDELPEIWHVLKGEMSLVGPRPLPLAYIDRYSSAQRQRLEVLPGITGLAQVSGRNALGWDDRLALDVAYVDRWSLWLDVKVLVSTIRVVLNGRDISHPGHATMEEFLGPGARRAT